MSRNPDPGRTPRTPMAGNPGGMRVRSGHVAARRPHPTAGPIPIPRCPHHRGPGRRRWDYFLLQRRGRRGWSGVSGTSVGRGLPWTGVGRRLRWIRVTRRLRWIRVTRRLRWIRVTRWLCRIGRRWVLLGGRRRQQSQQDRQDHRVADPTQRTGGGPCRYRSDFHRVDGLFSPLSSAGSCRVVSCPRTGSAMASSRLCAPFHSVDERTCPSLPI